MSHFKIAILLADWFDWCFDQLSFYSHILGSTIQQFFMDIHRTDSFIVIGADLEYNKKTFNIS